MSFIRTYTTKLVVLAIALQILNLSVYGADFDPSASSAHVGKIGEFNQIDSLVEYVAEIMLDHKDAFPENGNHNPNGKSSHQIKHSIIKMVSLKRIAEPAFYFTASKTTGGFKQDYKNPQLREINPPPPKA